MSGGDIRVDVELLHQHAGLVDQLASDAAQALSAVQSVNLSGGAFGLLCSWMVPPVSSVSQAVGSAIQQGGDAIERSASQLRDAAGDFQRYEESVVDVVRSLERGLG
ncbi:excreted virulence factor EspC (type VII ESX diderm) [Microbacterium sp. AG157]|uniref:type VII secretion target n=1 Tax=Microbacterium sp. AG157 TaxID=2183993 RepID=UPI000E273218|nr:type VII secretion target [Microbacterium sp. AG157]REC98258.1 excreted virulence factor EspC (type VII ESX diderm) [Microbacterium sp. AG157]